ncbi:MAG: hypothetical protein M5F18_05705 [Asgard group archaeon]|nr:hypothetical protein [Asgard group archaeon]
MSLSTIAGNNIVAKHYNSKAQEEEEKKKKQRADKARHWVIHIHLTRASPPVHNNLTEIRLNPTSTHKKKGK